MKTKVILFIINPCFFSYKNFNSHHHVVNTIHILKKYFQRTSLTII